MQIVRRKFIIQPIGSFSNFHLRHDLITDIMAEPGLKQLLVEFDFIYYQI
jgi:hypothetical protein